MLYAMVKPVWFAFTAALALGLLELWNALSTHSSRRGALITQSGSVARKRVVCLRPSPLVRSASLVGFGHCDRRLGCCKQKRRVARSFDIGRADLSTRCLVFY